MVLEKVQDNLLQSLNRLCGFDIDLQDTL